MAVLKVQILGSPHLRYGDQVIQINRQMPRAILYFLAANREVISREKLLYTFWPDQDPERSRPRLREALSRLRSTIPDPDVIQTTPETLWLDKNLCQVDLDQYWRSLDAAGQAPWAIPEQTPLPPRLASILDQAAALWQGQFLLEGARLPSTPVFDEWLTAANAQLIEQQVRVLRRLASHSVACGNLVLAIEYLQHALEFDDLDEDLVSQLIDLRLESGQIQLAQKNYREFAARLMRELGTTPGAELAAISRRFESQHALPAARPETSLNLHQTLDLPFVGRTDVFSMMERALQRGSLFFLHGAAGSGKSRLLQEFTRRRSAGLRILVARSRPNDQKIPLQMLVDALRVHIQPAEWKAIPAPWINYLSNWMPELHPAHTEAMSPAEMNQKSAAQEALRRLLLSLHQDRKLLFIIDDIHWCDEASIHTLAYLLDRPPFSTGALLILSGRDDYPNPDLDQWLSTLEPETQISSARLPGLTPSETLDLCQEAFQTAIAPDFASQIHAKTAGNPYFLLETIRSMLENNLEPSVYLPELPTPKTVSALIHTRLVKVSLLGGKFLTTAAVFGREFNAADVREVCEFTPLQTAQVLEELDRRALIEAVPGTPDLYQISHDAIVETALDSLYPARRAALHGSVFHLLERKHAANLDLVAVLLAGHAEQARLGSEAFEYWLRAAKNALRMFLPEEMLAAYQRADQIVDEYLDQLKVEQIYKLYSEWNDAAFETNDHEKLFAINQRLLELGERFQSALLTGTALDGLSDACMTLNRFEEGLQYAEQAVRALENSSSQFEYIEAQLHCGVIYYMVNRLADAEAVFDSLIKQQSWQANEPKSFQSRSNVHYQASLVKTLMGKPALGRLHGLAALEHSRRSRHPHNKVDAHIVLAFASHFCGRHASALQHAEAGIDLAEKLHASRMQGYLYIMYAMTQLLFGRIDASFAALMTARRLGEMFDQFDTISITYRLEGDVYFFLHLWDRAIVAYERGLEVGQQGFWALDNLFRLGAATASIGHAAKGIEYLESAYIQARQAGLGLIEYLTCTFLAHVYIQTGELDKAESYATQALRETQQRCLPVIAIGAKTALGYCAAARGDSLPARVHFQQAHQLANRMGDFWLEKLVLEVIQLAGQFMDGLPISAQTLTDRLSTLQHQLTNSTTNPEFHRAIQNLGQ